MIKRKAIEGKIIQKKLSAILLFFECLENCKFKREVWIPSDVDPDFHDIRED